jgi:hypothetical protein
LAPCAARYEAATGRPVTYLLARVNDPTPEDLSPFEDTVHGVAPGSPWVAVQVELLLQDHDQLWSGLEEPFRSRWIRLQALLAAYGLIEQAAAHRHQFSEIQGASVESLRLLAGGAGWRFQFSGSAAWRARMFRGVSGTSAVSGIMDLQFDRFGRVTATGHSIERVEPRGAF